MFEGGALRTNLLSMVARSVDLVPWGLRKRIKTLPGIARAQRWLLRRTMDGQEFVHRISAGPARGLVFRVRMPGDKLYWTGTWEHDVTSAIAADVPAQSVCCDIGGHRGFMAGIMALSGARRVYCFEPNPANLAALRDLRALNPQLPITPVDAAIGAADGEAEFALMPESSMGKLSSSPFQQGAQTSGMLKVKVRALDSLIGAGEIEAPDFIKIDIEGAEFDALQGARKLIETRHPVFLIELHSLDLLNRCCAFLESFGYAVRFVEGDICFESEAGFRVCHMLAKFP